MGGSVPGSGSGGIVVLRDTAGTWRSPPVSIATGFAARWHGLRPAPFGWGLVMRASSVHGRGLLEPVRLLSVDGEGRICTVCLLEPGRSVRTAAPFVVELPHDVPAPHPGARLEAEPILGGWPDV